MRAGNFPLRPDRQFARKTGIDQATIILLGLTAKWTKPARAAAGEGYVTGMVQEQG